MRSMEQDPFLKTPTACLAEPPPFPKTAAFVSHIDSWPCMNWNRTNTRTSLTAFQFSRAPAARWNDASVAVRLPFWIVTYASFADALYQ